MDNYDEIGMCEGRNGISCPFPNSWIWLSGTLELDDALHIAMLQHQIVIKQTFLVRLFRDNYKSHLLAVESNMN